MLLKKTMLFLFALIFIATVSPAGAKVTVTANVTRGAGEAESGPLIKQRLILPYVFATETLDTVVGVGAGTSGYGQDQLRLAGAVFGTSNESYGGVIAAQNLQLRALPRLFIDAWGALGHYTDQRAYIDGNPGFPDARAGSNDSVEDDFIQGEGNDNQFNLQLRYLFPVGHGRGAAVSTYWLDGGILSRGASGAESWNPFRSGKSFFELRYFARSRDIDNEDARGTELDADSNGFEFVFSWDNRDFPANPSRGSAWRASLTRDFGLFDSTNTWTVLTGEVSKYFSLGKPGRFRQKVLALNLWTADTPTWEENVATDRIDNRPPSYLGASLGNWDRFRAYPMNRFTDKAAIYYCAELRLIPEWNPLREVSWLRFLDIDWWQFVPFVEVGRVAPEWDLSTLHEDLKWDAGLGVRFMMRQAVVRFDAAFADESAGVWFFVGQPF